MTTVNTQKPQLNTANQKKSKDVNKRINSKVHQGLEFTKKIADLGGYMIDDKIYMNYAMKKDDVMDFFKSMQLDNGKNPDFNTKVIDKEIEKIQSKLENGSLGKITRWKLMTEMALLKTIKGNDANGDGRVSETEMLNSKNIGKGIFFFQSVTTIDQ